MPSSVIESARYDEEQKCLDIKYRSGKIYRYLNVPPAIYASYKTSYSKGEYLNLVIKKFYPFKRL